jgi:hypothetical protein
LWATWPEIACTLARSPAQAPAALGEVAEDAVGTTPRALRMTGALASARQATLACRVERRQPGGPRLRHPVSAYEHVVHEEADVVLSTALCPVRSHIWGIALRAGPAGQTQAAIAEGEVGTTTPPNRCHPEHVFGKERALLQGMGGQGERRDVRPALSPQDVPVLGYDGTARHHTVSCHRYGWLQYSMRESGLGSVIQVMLCSRSYDIVGRKTYVDQRGSRALWS